MSVKDLPPLKDIIAAHGLSAQKSLGQNFLLDLNITDKIAGYVYLTLQKPEETHLIEIGPGPGGLTRSLVNLETLKVSAIEFDTRAIEALQTLQEAAQGRLELLHGDAMEQDLMALTQSPRAIAANLPYNIATPLLIKWLRDIREQEQGQSYVSMTLMFQKEVGQRITATHGSKAYGRLAVIAQWLCHTKSVYDLPPSAFTPPPKVTSSVVQLTPKPKAESSPKFETVEKITAAAFNQRRKMIRQSLKPYMNVIEHLGLDPTLRAENITVEQYIKIAQHVEKL